MMTVVGGRRVYAGGMTASATAAAVFAVAGDWWAAVWASIAVVLFAALFQLQGAHDVLRGIVDDRIVEVDGRHREQ